MDTTEGSVLRGRQHSFARLLKPVWIDTKLRFKLKLDREAALHVNVRRGREVNPRYFVGFHSSQTSLAKQPGHNGFKNNLGTGQGPGSGWHSVEIRAVSDTLVVSIDEREVLRFKDPEPSLAVGMSFECLTTAAMYIDEIEVWGLGSAEELVWVHCGGPLGGIGYDVRMHPRNPDLMLVTDAQARVSISRDGGQSWQPSNAGITARSGETGEIIPIFCLTIDPNNPDIMWVGNTEQHGVFRSQDGGKTWERRDKGIVERSITMRGFSVDPRSSNIVYAAGEISSWEWNSEPSHGIFFDRVKGAIYKTIDHGENWRKVWEGDNIARYIWIDPRDSRILYASTGIFDREAAISDPEQRIPGGVGILKSTNGGRTWSTVNRDLDNLYVGTLYMHPYNPDVLIAGAGNVTYEQGSGVYLTTDAGKNWKRTLNTYTVTSVEFCESNSDIVYAGNVNDVYRSEDGCRSWRKMTRRDQGWWGPAGAAVGTPIDFQVDPRDPDRIFVNAYGGGNFLSQDGGRSWATASSGYTGAQVRDIAAYPDNSQKVIAAARSGIFTMYDAGTTGFVSCGSFDFEISAAGIRVSTDAGKSWRPANDERTRNLSIHKLAVHPGDPDIVFAGSTLKGLWKTESRGKRRQPVQDPEIPKSSVTYVGFDPNQTHIVFAGFKDGGLWASRDGGQSWRRSGYGVDPEATVSDMAFSTGKERAIYLADLRSGVYRSNDGGQSWRPINQGLLLRAVNDLALSHDGSCLYAASEGQGVFDWI